MKESVEALSVLVDKIYSAFILRDVAGKIVPGLLLLFPFIFSLINQCNLVTFFKLNFVVWLMFVILLWIMGYISQSFGELIGLVTYALVRFSRKSQREYKWDLCNKYYIISIEDMLEEQRKAYSEKESNSDAIKYIERLATIREACGNSASSLILSLPVYLYYFHTTNVNNQVLIIMVFLVFIFLLARMHKEHAYRYWYTLSKLTENITKRSNKNMLPLPISDFKN